jgi:hypothetical protein
MAWPISNPIARELDDFWKETQPLQQQFWVEADLDTKMATGQQDYWNSFFGANYRNQKMLQFNKILRIINMIGGYQRDNRLASIVSAADNDPDAGETASQRSTVLDWSIRQDNTYEKISDCFDGANICGLNLLNIWMDFREDPENGEIKTDRLPFNAFLMDPYWTKPDLSDCDRIWTRRYVNSRQLESMIPGIGKNLAQFGKGYAAKDGKFPYLAQSWNQFQQNMYAYDEYWVRDYKTVRKVLDTATGEVIPWKGTRDQFSIFRQFNPNIQLIKARVPTIKLHVLVNNQVVYEEVSPYGIDRFPFVPFICYHFPEVQNYAYRYQGIVRNIRDSQVELNRRRNRLLDIMDAQVQSGLMVKEDALVNPEDAYMQGPGKVLYFKQTANLASDVAPIPPPPVAQGWMELISTIEKEIMDIVGPEELFAQNMGAKEMTGVLMKLKMGAGLTGLRNIFDRLNQSQIYVSEIMDDMIVNNFSEGKVARILGKPPTESFFDNEFTKYSCIVEEAELTSTQRQLKFLQAVQLKQIIPDSIDDAYLLKTSSLQDKKELIENAEARAKQVQELQQAQAEQELRQGQVLARSLEAKAQNDFASAEEKKAKAVADIAMAKERSSQAMHDRASAGLENAKALKELDEMDETRLIKLADFILTMQERQKAIQGGEEADALAESAAVGSGVEQAEQSSKPK